MLATDLMCGSCGREIERRNVRKIVASDRRPRGPLCASNASMEAN